MRKELSIDTRAKIVAFRQAKPILPEISKQLRLASPNTARNFHNTYCKTGSLESKKRRGRPQKTTVLLLQKPSKTLLHPVNSFSVSSISSPQRREYRLIQSTDFEASKTHRTRCCEETNLLRKKPRIDMMNGSHHSLT